MIGPTFRIDSRTIRIRKRRVASVSGPIYHVIADIISKIQDPVMRKAVADHFATEFNKRSSAFDPVSWNQATGGTPAANSAR